MKEKDLALIHSCFSSLIAHFEFQVVSGERGDFEATAVYAGFTVPTAVPISIAEPTLTMTTASNSSSNSVNLIQAGDAVEFTAVIAAEHAQYSSAGFDLDIRFDLGNFDASTLAVIESSLNVLVDSVLQKVDDTTAVFSVGQHDGQSLHLDLNYAPMFCMVLNILTQYPSLCF